MSATLYGESMQITININNADTEPSVHVEQHFDAPVAEPIPRIVSAYPHRMSDEARRNLWAAWHNVFVDDDAEARAMFTRTALGLSYDDDASWSRNGSLTDDQTYHLIRVLSAVRDIR